MFITIQLTEDEESFIDKVVTEIGCTRENFVKDCVCQIKHNYDLWGWLPTTAVRAEEEE